MKNLEISRVFLEIAGLLEITGADAFRVRAYRKAARSVETLPDAIEEMAATDRLEEIPGVGKALASKIREILETGTCRYLEELRETVPREVLEILRIPGVGARTAALLYRVLGIVSVEDLERTAKARRLRNIPGFGPKKEESILRGIEALRRHGQRVLLGVALPEAESILRYLGDLPEALEVSLAGSLRRMRETVKDVDIVASSREPEALMDGFTSMPGVIGVVRNGPTESTISTYLGQVDLRVVAPHEFPAALHHFTGSREHNVRLRGIARKMGLRINEYGVFREPSGEPLDIREEADIYRILGMEWIPPELREDNGEVEAAMTGRLPQLVTLQDIKGDLHLHTTYSDGIATIAEMARAAKGMGYQYMAVSDHTKSLKIAGGLDEERVREQGEEIRALNENLEEFQVLRGSEVDILSGGRLDLDDSVLEDLDVVVASIHQGFSQSSEVLNERVEGAMKNPHVDIIGHPTGRLLGRREPYALDVENLLDLASKTGTALEVNACPDRLDLGDEHARKAAARGIKLAIGTDAHSVSDLRDMRYGVGVARRAWLSKFEVLNAMDLDELRTFLE